MTARDSYNEMKFDESEARGRELKRLRALTEKLQLENDELRQQLAKKKLKVGPPQHPGQLSIGGTEEAK